MDLFRSIQLKLAQRERGATTEGLSAALSAPDEPSQVPARIVEPHHELHEELHEEPPFEPQATQLAPDREIGRVLRDRYEIISRLGCGRFSTVYKAVDRLRSEHLDVDCHVAIKSLNEEARGQPEILSQLRREFYSAQKLSHPSIVKVYELDRDQDFIFFSMEPIDCELISQVQQKFYPQPLPRSYVWAVLREVGEGLAHAHERRVIHGDLSPQSIMVSNAGELRILGFGASGKSATAAMPAYASCEVLEGREPDPRDDLFALACLSYELLSGKHPFQQRLATEARSINLIPQRPAGLTSRQWRALTRGLAWERASRTLSVRDWLKELNPGTEPLGSIPQLQDLKPERTAFGPATPARLVAILATLIVSMVTWVVLHQPAGKTDGVDDTVAETQAPASGADLDALNYLQSADSQTPTDDAPRAPMIVKKPHGAAAAAARAGDKIEKIGLVAGTYRIAPGEKFAEIQVHRTSGANAGTSFEWWTESASAVEGVDYVPQNRATMSFSRGRQTASLFIKLLPNESRKRTDVFYVVIGNPSNGTALGAVSKAKIALPPANGVRTFAATRVGSVS
jgi:serine/threonine protein kinase